MLAIPRGERLGIAGAKENTADAGYARHG